VQGQGGEEGARPRAGRLRHVARLADWASIQYQNANNSVRVSDAFMEAATKATSSTSPPAPTAPVVETVDARDLLRQIAAAAWECAIRASSTTRRSTRGTRSRTRAASTRRTRARSTCRSTTRRATSRRSTS
jgi:hypothetical protein